jgi:hypothetical protein
MGNYPSQGDKEEKARSDVIDSFLKKETKRYKNERKILLMGESRPQQYYLLPSPSHFSVPEFLPLSRPLHRSYS